MSSLANHPFVVAQIKKAQQALNEQMRDRYNPQQVNPNAGIPSQYTQQASNSDQPSGGLMGANSLMPMRAYREMYGRQGSPAQMQQNRQNYQGQYGSAESLQPMQMLNQYQGTTGTGGAPTTGNYAGPAARTGGK